MGAIREYKTVSRQLFLCLCIIAASLIIHCDSRKTRLLSKDHNSIINNHLKNLKKFKHLDIDPTASPPSYNLQPYISSPFSFPPFDSLPPTSLPDSIGSSTPPLCLNPPSTPMQTLPTPPSSIPITQNPPPASTTSPSPSQSNPSPSIPNPTPPGSSSSLPTPTTPIQNPTPPGSSSSDPTPTTPGQSPPGDSEPNPPTDSQPTPPSDSEPSPPGGFEPSPPGGFVPSPPSFMPPIVYPPPQGPPSSGGGGGGGGGGSGSLWCVAKPSVPDPIIQEAMNYACGSGADCNDIQESGKCYQPDTLFAHASYAFNSYWQRTKVAGGTCDFGGTAMLVTVDPSYDGCHFLYA